MERFTLSRDRTKTASFIRPACLFSACACPPLNTAPLDRRGGLAPRTPPWSPWAHLFVAAPTAFASRPQPGAPTTRLAWTPVAEGPSSGRTTTERGQDNMDNHSDYHESRWQKPMENSSVQHHNPPSPPSDLVIRTQHTRMNTAPYPHPREIATFSGPSSSSDAVRALRLRANRAVNTSNVSPDDSPNALLNAIYKPTPGSQFALTTTIPLLRPPPNFPTRNDSAKYYFHVSRAIQMSLLNGFKVHPMSPTEIEEYNLATIRRLERVKLLEEMQEKLLPRRDVNIEQTLYAARLDYRHRMYRTFRMHDLPIEIIQNIFRFVCWTPADPDTNVRWRVQISSVCRLWREALLSDGTVWSAIWFRHTNDFERSFTWLDRAGQTPVDIRINDAVDKPWTLEATKECVDRLFLKLPTIRILIVVLHDWDPILYILNALSRVPELNVPIIMERLEVHRSGPAFIQIGTGFTPDYYTDAIPLFGGANVPSFKYLTMNGAHIDWPKSMLGSLTTLDMRRIPLERAPTLEQFRAVLSSCPQITKLVLDGAGPRWPTSHHPLKPILMPELRTLILGDFALNYGAYLISQIICPSVLDLTLMNLIGEDYSHLYAIMTGRTPNVLSLTLYGAETRNVHPVALERIVKWLRAMPKIGFMRLKNVTHEFLNLFCWDGEKLVNTLTTAPGPDEKFEHPICPALKTLELHMVPPEMIKNWGIGRMLQGVPIAKVYVGSQSAKPLTREEAQTIAMGVQGPVIAMAYPGKPQEEKDLLGETW